MERMRPSDLRPSVKKSRAESPDKFDGLPKFLKGGRIDKITKSGELEFRRLLLSRDPVVREKLTAVQRITEKLCAKYPEMLGITLYASQVKGYAEKNSDIDAYVFIDADKIRRFHNVVDKKIPITTLPRYVQIKREITQNMYRAGLSQERKEGFRVFPLSRADVIAELRRSADSFSHNEFLYSMPLFQPCIGRGIYKYREIVISTLERTRNTAVGKRIWYNLMNELWDYENMPFNRELRKKRRDLYPWALSQGRKCFIDRVRWKPRQKSFSLTPRWQHL